MPVRGKHRGESRQTDWFKRWRTGDFRTQLTYLKQHKEPSRTHPRDRELVDLRGANLRMAKLANARLNRCCFNEAEMYKTNLVAADISESELIEVDLCYANLQNALLVSSTLANANLKRADLAGANLRGADFTGAQLAGANFFRASIDDAVFSLANLIGAKGLETATGMPRYANECRIDSETLDGIRDTGFGTLLVACGKVVESEFKYDVALSFAGEDRKVAESIAEALRSMRVSVFYDEYEKADLWGKNLYDHLSDVYRAKARFCLMLLSTHYAQKQWTNHERQAAQDRAFLENREYILPLKLDDAEVTGVLGTVGYLRFDKETPLGIARLVKEKLKASKR